MSDSFPSVPDLVARFFDNYLNCLDKASVPEKQRRWYVKRVEAFIKAHSGRKIKSLTSQEVNEYLEMLGRRNRLLGGQFVVVIAERQSVKLRDDCSWGTIALDSGFEYPVKARPSDITKSCQEPGGGGG